MGTNGLVHSIGGFALPGRHVGMTLQWIKAILRARFLVASLGEKASPQWWRSDATDLVSQRMLQRLYPRTALAASLDTASRAAAREHDAHIGTIDVYHLFRLPAVDEAALHQHVLSAVGIDQIRHLAELVTPDAQMNALRELADDEYLLSTHGPVMCGPIATMRTNQTQRRICAAYLAGFTEQQAVYPYLAKGEAS